VEVPLIQNVGVVDNPTLGARVVPAELVFGVLNGHASRYSPTLSDTEMLLEGHINGHSPFGWRLEHFVADLVLGCREGRIFGNADRDAINALFYRRSGPIAATIAITIEAPDDADLGDEATVV
jgi:hypothetical protein